THRRRIRPPARGRGPEDGPSRANGKQFPRHRRRLAGLNYNMQMITDDTRRRFLTAFSGLGLGGTLLPGALLAQVQQTGEARVTAAMLANALAVAGLTFSEEDQKAMLQAVNRSVGTYEELRKLAIPNDVAPPFYFSPLVPGMKVNRTREPLRFSAP